MKQSLVLVLLLVVAFIMAACGTGSFVEPTPTSTPQPNEAQMLGTLFADKIGAEATQARIEMYFTATAQILGATQTQQSIYMQATGTQQARADIQATADQGRQDAQATQARRDFEATQEQARRDAQATSDQARLDLAATQQAQATAAAWVVTEAVIPTHNLWTQQAVEQEILLATNAVELSNLEVEQQQQKNTIEWVWPIVVAVFLTGVLGIYAYNYSQVREIKNGDGGTEIIVFKNRKAIAPRLLPKPVLELKSGEMHDVTDPKEQSEIVKRDQAIKALEAMPVNPSNNGVQAFNSMFAGANEKKSLPVIEIASPEQIGRDVLDEVEGQVMEEGDQ